jgi:cobaltochelatase CobT
VLRALRQYCMQKKANEPPGSARRYRAYTTEFDREITGDQIPQLLGTTSSQLLNAYISGLEPGISRWRASAEIALIEANHRYAGLEVGSKPNTVATLLLDHSGSMRGQRAILAIALTEILADYWSRIGWNFEILGFTTASWHGGKSRRKWARWGRRTSPGRLCDILHIIYRHAESAPGAPWSIRYLAHRDLLKENVDGEALEWAAARLRNREEPNKLIFVVSDGAPVDDSTLQANSADYLDRHLRQVIDRIELSGEIMLVGIGLDYDVAPYYARQVTIRAPEDLATRLVPFLTTVEGSIYQRTL